MNFEFPTNRPEHCPAEIWALQQLLLTNAEALLGQRDQSKKIYQPVFKTNGPYVINTPNLDGGLAALSINAANNWHTVIYELAHETVHLLNPVAGHTNNLEEGIAVAFAVEMSRTLTSHPIVPGPDSGSYLDALDLVYRLPGSCFEAAKNVRDQLGSLSAATFENLRLCFPNTDEKLLVKLAEQFKPR